MSAVGHLIAGAFAGLNAPFALHPNDRTRALKYLEAAMAANLSWQDAEQDIRDYLGAKGEPVQKIQKEVDRARPYLQHWLS